MNSMPFRQLKSFFKILIGVQYDLQVGYTAPRPSRIFCIKIPRLR